ncbi:EAL domain-containing protein [Asticcacaulis sp. W401b]|uniref:sensor domain-containing protein n=1 Tax=Asticcacaulis sp. W401b TaxID=3388666 RepID=UPI003970E51B
MTVPLTPPASLSCRYMEGDATELTQLKGEAVDAIDTAMVITDTSGRFLYVNEAFRNLLGFSASELSGNTLGDLCRRHSDSCEHLEDILTDVHRNGQRSGELLVHDRNGHPMWVSFSATAMTDAAHRRRVIAIVSDITYAKLNDTLQRLVFDAMMQDKPLPETMSLLCLEVEHMVQDVRMSVLRVAEGKLNPLAAPGLPDWYNAALAGLTIGPVVGSCGTAAWRGEPVMVNDMRSDPLWAPYQALAEPLGYTACWSTPFKDKAGTVIGTFAFYSTHPFVLNTFVQCIVDICTQLCTLAFEKDAFQARIQYLAHHDSLTGLPNRGFYQTRLAEEAARATRQKTQLALHLIDLDRFKEVNDTMGHMVGDEVLITVAETLRDLASPGDVLARLGGDEFVFLQVGVTRRAQAEAKAEALVSALQAEMQAQFGHQAPDVGASLGFALYPDEGPTLDRLTRHADMALYKAKTDGRGCWRAFDATMAEALRRRRRLEADLRDALAHGQRGLSLVYQPQFCLNLNRFIGYEALVRWTHPELGSIPPIDFIPVAEEAGLITALGQWILSRALETAATWPAHLNLAVNLSPLQICEGDLTRYVQQELIRTGFRPQRLELEVTEGVLIENTDRALHVLRKLKGMGVRIAMDDFGTGYSSLSYLQTFPFDLIKIDRSFVEGLTPSPDRKVHKHGIPAEAIVRAVIGMAHAINIPVIAEGVETQEQMDLLRDMGADAVQGYLIGRPQAYCLSEAPPALLAAGQR